MELLSLTIMELLYVLSLSILVQVSLSGTFAFQNNCPYTVWPATFSGTTQFLQTGVELPTGGPLNLDAPMGVVRHVGPHQMLHGCLRRFSCLSADCSSGQVGCNSAGGAPPAIFTEFTLSRSADIKDFYDTSIVDGFNVPISMTPVGVLGDVKVDCITDSCAADINSICPNQQQDKAADGPSSGANAPVWHSGHLSTVAS